MAIRQEDEELFDAMCDAAQDDRLALMECQDRETGEYRAVICIITRVGDGVQAEPVGQMVVGNPFEQYIPPGDPQELIIPGNRTEQ